MTTPHNHPSLGTSDNDVINADVDAVKALLNTAARMQPREHHPAQVILRRRRRARLKTAGLLTTAGAVLTIAAGAAITTGALSSHPGTLHVTAAAPISPDPTPHPTASNADTGLSPQAVSDALNAALAEALPTWRSASNAGPDDVQVMPGGERNWTITVTGTGTTPAVTLQVSSAQWSQAQVTTWAQSPCQWQQGSDCTSQTLSSGTIVVRGTEEDTMTLSRGASADTNGTLTYQAPYAEAVLPGGRLVNVTASLVGTAEQPLRVSDTFPAASAATPQTLQALITDPHLAAALAQ